MVLSKQVVYSPFLHNMTYAALKSLCCVELHRKTTGPWEEWYGVTALKNFVRDTLKKK